MRTNDRTRTMMQASRWVLPVFMVLAASSAGTSDAEAQAAAPASVFLTSDRCMGCHNGLTTPDGQDVSVGFDWRPSMMANAARDPYWQASVRRETLDHPSLRGAIEDKCSTCHMPMSRFTQKQAGGSGQVLSHLPIGSAATPDALLAGDGVSCSVCHQTQPANFGREESFTGGFLVDTRLPAGRRQVFGSFEVEAGRRRVMQSSAGFLPVRSSHLKQSEMCATCHTLYTHAYDSQGREVGKLPEQVPYLEWRHSAYRTTQSCQSCHMPAIQVQSPISSVLPNPHEGVSRHVFRGGNFLMPRLFNRYRAELGVVASPQELEAVARRTTDHLTTRSARLTIDQTVGSEGVLDIDVTVQNLAGHKLPTAYPSRRVWIHLTVVGRAGQVLFESGRLMPNGQIVGNDNDADPARYEPHHELIQRRDQVQIYEAVMVDADKRVTTGLLRGVQFIKDNRILPAGFDKATAAPDVAVRGHAAEDADFTASTDRVRYRASVAGAQGPVLVRAELWYQPIGFRWAENLAGHSTSETNRFVSAYRSMSDVSAVMLTSAERRVESFP